MTVTNNSVDRKKIDPTHLANKLSNKPLEVGGGGVKLLKAERREWKL